jgi:methyl-accepting chemotaxis protein
VGLIIGVSGVLVISLYLSFKNSIAGLPISQEIANQLLADSMHTIVIVAVIMYFASLWALIMITHKIYGPLYRFTQYIKKLSEGQKTNDLVFRRGDAIVGLKEIYNELRRSLERALFYDYKEMVKVFSQLEDILDKLYDKQIEHQELYSSLEGLCKRIAKALDVTSGVIQAEKH